MDATMLQGTASLFKALGHPTRLQIVLELLEGTKCVADIQEILPTSQANISQHLSILRHAGLVGNTQDGARRCYYVSRPEVAGVLAVFLGAGASGNRTAASPRTRGRRRPARTAGGVRRIDRPRATTSRRGDPAAGA